MKPSATKSSAKFQRIVISDDDEPKIESSESPPRPLVRRLRKPNIRRPRDDTEADAEGVLEVPEVREKEVQETLEKALAERGRKN